MKILITGHPYAFPYYRKVFEYAPDRANLIFVLPKVWEAKDGKVHIELKSESSFKTYGLTPVSYGGRSLLAGLFKGYLPGMIWLAPYLKLRYGAKIMYSCSEPNLLTTLFNGLSAKLSGMKYVIFTWQNVPPEKRLSGLKLKMSNWLVKTNLKLADGVICGNQKAKKIVISNWSSVISSILICSLSGVDTDKFKSFGKAQGKPESGDDWRKKLNIKPEERIILFYGALDKRKSLDVLVDAFHLLITDYSDAPIKTIMGRSPDTKSSGPTTGLVIIGTGPEKQNLIEQAKEKGISSKIKFIDWMANDKLPAIVRGSDIFVYPSVPHGGWEEQFGYAMAEASASGIPVVATQTGSIDEVVKDGETGILVPPGNAEKLAGALKKLLANEDLRKEMGRAGRNFIVENFSHEIIAKKIEKFLHSA